MVFALAVVMAGILAGCSSTRPGNLGVKNGKFTPCPDSPNCVSTFTKAEKHGMEPIRYEGPREDAVARIKSLIAQEARAQIIVDEPHYLHAEFKSALFGFVDDVEFYFPQEERIIHFRSASRVGHSDFGVNRKRMEKFHKSLIPR